MNPGILKILLHVGGIVKEVKDIEALIGDLLKKDGAAASADAKKALVDLADLMSSGVINVPGMAAADGVAALQAFAAVL